jgi:hypothetical protein
MLLLLAAAAGGSAFAQSGGANNDPREPEAKVPRPVYRSAFEDYRPFREPEPAPWRDVNEEVARIGGHVGLMKKKDDKPAADSRRPGEKR